MRAGRAIVATDVAANRLILDHSRSLLVASAPEPLAEGILALARDPDRRRRLGGAARRHYKRAYGFERFKQRLAHCYQKVLLGGLGALGLRLWRKGDALRDEVLDLAIETCEFWLPTLI
jgi:glycosyltransferase involved in cell wall biosynthesis